MEALALEAALGCRAAVFWRQISAFRIGAVGI